MAFVVGWGPIFLSSPGSISPLQGPVLTRCAEPRVFVIAVGAVWRTVAQVLDGDAISIARTSERFVRVTCVACNEGSKICSSGP
jgi:hypothetical protein